MKYDNDEYSNYFAFRYDAEQDNLEATPSYDFTIFTLVICGLVFVFMVIVTASNPQGWSPTNMPSIAEGIASTRENIATADDYDPFEEDPEDQDPFGDDEDIFST
jgi:hypothetical protein